MGKFDAKSVFIRRLYWLEFITAWCGPSTVQKVADVLGLARETVQRSVVSRAPHLSIKKKPRGGIEFVGGIGDMKYGPHTPSQVLALLSWDQSISNATGLPTLIDVSYEDTHELISDLKDPEKFRTLFTAAAMKVPVTMTYAAKRGIRIFSFSPHAVVRTHARIHFRGYAAYEGGSGKFIDLVPERMISYATGEKSEYFGPQDDDEWNTYVSMSIKPKTDDVKILQAIVSEFGSDEITVVARKSNVRYIEEVFAARSLLWAKDFEVEWNFTVSEKPSSRRPAATTRAGS